MKILQLICAGASLSLLLVVLTLFQPFEGRSEQKLSIIAHRGACMDAPENTLPAFEKAIEKGFDYIECDVKLTADNIPIIFHDTTTYRTTNLKKDVPITSLTLAQVRSLDAGSWLGEEFAGVKIPTLKEVLSLDRKGVGLMLELKTIGEKDKLLVQAVSKILKGRKEELEISGPIYIGSISIPIMRLLNKDLSEYPKVAITETVDDFQELLRINPDRIALTYPLLQTKEGQILKSKNIPLWIWGDSNLKGSTVLLEPQIDGIITDNIEKYL